MVLTVSFVILINGTQKFTYKNARSNIIPWNYDYVKFFFFCSIFPLGLSIICCDRANCFERKYLIIKKSTTSALADLHAHFLSNHIYIFSLKSFLFFIVPQPLQPAQPLLPQQPPGDSPFLRR